MPILVKLSNEEAATAGVANAEAAKKKLLDAQPIVPAPEHPESNSVEAIEIDIPAATSVAQEASASAETIPNETISSLSEKLEATETKLSALVAETDEKIKRAIAQAAVEMTAAAGIPPVAASPASEKKTKNDLLSQMNSIEDPSERSRFYQQHRNELLG